MATIKDLPPEIQRRWRANCAKGGRNGSREAKVRAGKMGMAARLKKRREAEAQQQQNHT